MRDDYSGDINLYRRPDHEYDHHDVIDGARIYVHDKLDSGTDYVVVRRDDYDKLVAIVYNYDSGDAYVDINHLVVAARNLVDHVAATGRIP